MICLIGMLARMSFHFVRMYKDAARLKIYKDTGRFPMVTKSTGLKSLEEVLREDAKFPTLKQELIEHQGWNLIDLSEDERVSASDIVRIKNVFIKRRLFPLMGEKK